MEPFQNMNDNDLNTNNSEQGYSHEEYSYNNYSNHNEYRQIERPNMFAIFAKSLGIFAVFCAFFSVFYGTFICGGLAIVLAWLSKGSDMKMAKNARTGLIAGSIAVVIQIAVFAVSIYNILYVPEFRQQFNSLYEQMYGEPLDETLNELLEDSGFFIEEGGNL